ncbi:hypothetical protein [Methylovulum miyakonense]|uniref:hypothetical protein n=1 Tax=Methylovulum miyakonense TaxID=645578 RepID=UPI00036866B1|nr:hypothetical protein [Methylovulum miyakonense]
MQTIKTHLMALWLATFLTGCNNAMYFYETEKVALNVEARPDSSQPVQGSLGLKQRVVLVAPKKTKYSDIVSALSSFSFNIIPNDANYFFNPVLIQTAFITGGAATDLKPLEAKAAAKAIVQDGGNSTGADVAIMANVVNVLQKRNTKEAHKHLSLLDGLAKAIIPAQYPVSIFDTPNAPVPHTPNLIVTTTLEGKPIPFSSVDITWVLTYWDSLQGSADLLKRVFAAPQNYQLDGGIPVTNDMVIIGLQKEYEKTRQELTRLAQEFAGDPVYTNALHYYVDK